MYGRICSGEQQLESSLWHDVDVLLVHTSTYLSKWKVLITIDHELRYLH